MAEPKRFQSKRKSNAIPFEVETDEGIKSYFIVKLTCAQVTEWYDFVRERQKQEKDRGYSVAKDFKETFLSLAVVDQEYKPLTVSSFNELGWTEEVVSSVYDDANELNFPEFEKKES